ACLVVGLGARDTNRVESADVKIVIAGGTGALGRRVAADLGDRGCDVVILTRSPRADVPHRQVVWDGVAVGEWAGELRGAVVINLAGELVDRPPTAANVELLTRSRTAPTAALAKAAAGLDDPPPVWLQASTLAIYGDGGEAVLDETAPPADGPPQMAGVATAWEAAAAGAPAGRQVVLRAAPVFDRDTPALNRLTGITRWGLGGRVGSGRQWVSWLHIDDFLAIVRRVLDDDGLSGVVHAVSPNPVRNAELMRALRTVLRRPPAPPTPAPLVRMGAVLLRTDPALALTGRRCVPRRLTEAGFEFAHPLLPPALHDLLDSRA
ncbi:MAG: epimerase, partial [Stackebrandtia sp.]